MTRATLLLILCLLFSAGTGLSHQTSDAYLALWQTNATTEGRLALALRDLDHVLIVDADKDGEVSEPELTAGRPAIEKYVKDRLSLRIDGEPAEITAHALETSEHDEAIYIDVALAMSRAGGDYVITYKLFDDTDPLHRGLFRFDLPNQTLTTIFSPREPTQRFFAGPNAPEKKGNFATFVREGVWHIWIGFDHILFLIALLLPSVLRRHAGQWAPIGQMSAALMNVLKVVTAFTISHSITLTAATLGWVNLSGRLVESVIAVSVALAAINNVKAIFPDRIWIVAFAFGLIHGFGFASVLGELELKGPSLAWTLLGFNIGVELGQLAIVIVFVPIAFALRNTRFYRNAVLRGGSIATAAIALAWFVERATDQSFMPF